MLFFIFNFDSSEIIFVCMLNLYHHKSWAEKRNADTHVVEPVFPLIYNYNTHIVESVFPLIYNKFVMILVNLRHILIQQNYNYYKSIMKYL